MAVQSAASGASSSITYLISELPNFTSESLPKLKEYFGYKRNCGGAGEVADCQAISNNSILLTYEKSTDAPKVMEYSHVFDGKEAKLHPVLEEMVTVTYQGSAAEKIDVEKAKLVAERNGIVFYHEGTKLCLQGDWYGIDRFRQHLQGGIVKSLKTMQENGSHTSIQSSSKHKTGTVSIPSLSGDVLALMKKCSVYQNEHLTYDIEVGGVTIVCPGDDEGAATIAEEFQTQYQQLMMGKKLKEHSFPIPSTYSKQQIDELVTQCNNDYSQSIFKHDSENSVVKCLSMNARQLSYIKKDLFQQPSATPSASESDTHTSMSLSLPGGRMITLKKANIVEETVDAIVNAANERLVHGAGVAAAINRASQGKVQQLSSVLFQKNGPVSTSHAVHTEAGGSLKCKFVIHAVGPEQHKHKNQSKQLLKNTCINALKEAEKLQAKSVALPPISSGLFGLPKDMVAEVLLDVVCGYQCQKAALLKDIRIVIIDEETFKIFTLAFANKEAESSKACSSQQEITAPRHTHSVVPQQDACPICFDTITDTFTTPCGHIFCCACLKKALLKNLKCPMCNQSLPPLQGTQPPGKMKHRMIDTPLSGYDQYNTIVITYEIPSGIQSTEHPKPGDRFQGVTRVAYLPNSPEGRDVLELFKKAFEAKLIFTVGTSLSTKKDNTVVWNHDISHKTTTESGRYGYPDKDYLQRVKEELRLKGIV